MLIASCSISTICPVASSLRSALTKADACCGGKKSWSVLPSNCSRERPRVSSAWRLIISKLSLSARLTKTMAGMFSMMVPNRCFERRNSASLRLRSLMSSHRPDTPSNCCSGPKIG
ncbi:hypothetical protein D3C81_2010860 [compost metagenome]